MLSSLMFSMSCLNPYSNGIRIELANIEEANKQGLS